MQLCEINHKSRPFKGSETLEGQTNMDMKNYVEAMGYNDHEKWKKHFGSA